MQIKVYTCLDTLHEFYWLFLRVDILGTVDAFDEQLVPIDNGPRALRCLLT